MERQDLVLRASGAARPRLKDSSLNTSMTAAGSSFWGQRWVQVRQPTSIPDGRAAEGLFDGRLRARLQQPHELIGPEIHVLCHRAAGGALTALVAFG